MGHRVAQSLVGSEGCIMQPRRSCILELKNGGNGRAPPVASETARGPERASLQPPSHYLFNVTRPREDNARRHSQILPSLFFTFLYDRRWIFTIWAMSVLSSYSLCALYNSPHPISYPIPSHPIPAAWLFNFRFNFLPTRPISSLAPPRRWTRTA